MSAIASTAVLCPQVPCGARVRLATETEAAAGAWLWRCGNGHHGPRILFPGPDDR